METKFCTDCIHQDLTQFEEPCWSCLDNEERPEYLESSNM